MDQTPPPPPPEYPSRRPAGGARPGVITAVAVLMFVGGGLSVLAGLLAVGGGGMLGDAFGGGGTLAVFGILVLAVGAVQIYAGVQILGLRERGRILGIVIAGLSALLTLPQLGDAAGSAIISLAIDAFIIWALVTNAEVFQK